MNVAETKIHSALKHAAASIRNDGLSPDDALFKAAEAQELNPEMTRRTAEMLNVSLTRAHFGSGQDKTASFPLADAGAVIERVFGSGDKNSKQASAAPASAPASDDERFRALLGGEGSYRFGPSVGKTVKIAAPLGKGAANLGSDFWKRALGPRDGSRPAPPPRDVDLEVRQAERFRGEIKRRSETARQKAAAAFDNVGATLRALVGCFDHVEEAGKYAAFEDQAYDSYGADVESSLDFVRAQLPRIMARGDRERFAGSTIKRASSRVWKTTVPNTLFDTFLTQLADYRATQKEADEVQRDAADKLAALDDAYHLLSGHDPKPAATASDLLDFGSYFAPIDKQAGLEELLGKARTLVGIPDHAEIAAKTIADQAADRYAKGHMAQQHMIHKSPGEAADHEMANVRREAIMRDLLTNDEIISRHDPAHIQSAYNGLLSIAPEATTNREVLRAFLRNATAQQAIDPFQAKQLADLGNVTLKNQNLRAGKKEDGTPI